MSSETGKIGKNKRINIDVIFAIMLTLSLAMTYAFYMAWNSPRSLAPDTSGGALKFFHIDSCAFGERDVAVTGWAFLPGNWKILNRVYAEKSNGNMVELMSSFQPRRDVGDAFNVGGMYDKSGFIATRHDSSAREDFTKKLLIVSFDEKGVGHAATYTCK
ncbi:hypothetical protein CYR55_08355 [Chimaeribacter californicus]|uniref:Uncharacterized protein n=1 Tax=Chimaeribacter californicus TaxID=2060067 RepID=A0A2N5EA25_9GAMM|nr:hypothetical protein [Chimaeribacter californicus]PLR38747.1 hypothetical protein CYR55_08355 [Chimaeribacter californicus]